MNAAKALRRIHRIVCLSILAALAAWAQNQNAGPKIQSVTCPATLTAGGMVTCTITLNKAAAKGGMVIVTNANNPAVTTATPVTIPEGKTSTSFQVRAQ